MDRTALIWYLLCVMAGVLLARTWIVQPMIDKIEIDKLSHIEQLLEMQK